MVGTPFQEKNQVARLLHSINLFALFNCKDYCLIPYSTISEDDTISNIFIQNGYSQLYELGLLRAALREETPEEFLEKKLEQYNSHPDQYGYFKKNAIVKLKQHTIPIYRRDFEVGKSIRTRWLSNLKLNANTGIWQQALSLEPNKRFYKNLKEIPKIILDSGKGIIWPLVKKLLDTRNPIAQQAVRASLHNLYFTTFVHDEIFVIITDTPLSHTNYGLNYYSGHNYSYKVFRSFLSRLELESHFFHLKMNELVILREIPEIIEFKKTYNSVFGSAVDIEQAIDLLNELDSRYQFSAVRSLTSKNRGLEKVIKTFQLLHDNLINKNALANVELDSALRDIPTVVILTALQEEYKAVRLHLENCRDVIKDDSHYEQGIFKYNDVEICSVIIRECGQRNAVASQETERAIRFFSPTVMLFVGIAGSRKPNDFGIGDVIFPDTIYSYEGGRAEYGSFLSRPDLQKASYTLLEIAKSERRKDDWKTLLKDENAKIVKANIGVVASGEKLIEHYNSGIGQLIKNNYNDTSAIEMEGFGFATAAHRQGRDAQILLGVVRGISDVIKNDGEKISIEQRPTHAKELASSTAAAFSYWLLYKLFTRQC